MMMMMIEDLDDKSVASGWKHDEEIQMKTAILIKDF